MVTINPNEVPAGTTVATTNRGFVPAGEIVVPATVQAPGVAWGGIISGAIATLAVLALSAALGYACEASTARPVTGEAATGTLYFGWGAAIWAWITAIIAFYVGGMTASLAARRYLVSGALQGFLSWSLVVALGLIFSGATIGTFQATGSMFHTNGLMSPAGNFPSNVALAAWSAFICLGLGLIFSVIGASAGSTKMVVRTP